MKKVIIGIHGLKNKASKELLTEWWKAAIHEGLSEHSIDQDFNFEMVYWADLNYEEPLDPKITDEDNTLYLKNPYVPGNTIEEDSYNNELKKIALDKLEEGMDKIFLKENSIAGLEHIADLTIRKMFIDLDTYYHGNCRIAQNHNAMDAYREKLADVLKKYKKHQIMLISHSMGSIISYDTLTQTAPSIKIDTLITIGSPLGNSIIVKKILQEQNLEISENSKPKTPENISRYWLNYSDLDDKVAMNYNLADDFAENSSGVFPLDEIVKNNYIYNGQKNPHKVYGYLRSPQVSEGIYKFLNRKNSWLDRMLKRIGVR